MAHCYIHGELRRKQRKQNGTNVKKALNFFKNEMYKMYLEILSQGLTSGDDQDPFCLRLQAQPEVPIVNTDSLHIN